MENQEEKITHTNCAKEIQLFEGEGKKDEEQSVFVGYENIACGLRRHRWSFPPIHLMNTVYILFYA